MSATFSFLLEYMGVPVGVEDGSGVSAEEGHQLGGAAILVDGNDGESTTTACFPVDGDVLRIGLEGMSSHVGGRVRGCADLDQVGIPSVLRDTEVVVALFLKEY